MSEQIRFTVEEENELRRAMKNGGIFLKLFANPDVNVEVQATDGNGGWQTIQKFNTDISSKIKAVYNEKDGYKVPLAAGFRQVSLSWFIATYC